MKWYKLHPEFLTSYTNAKLELCSRVQITGVNAVSSIIHGIAAELKANAQAICTTPEALYNKSVVGWRAAVERCLESNPWRQLLLFSEWQTV